MKKIIYLKTEIKIGEMIMYEGLEIEATQKLINDNPSIFETIVKDTPMYFKALNGIKSFTTGRIYKQVDSIGYPNTIKLLADDNRECIIYNWQSNYLHLNYNCFELTTKAEWDKQELLDEAKKRYPVGTVYKHFNSEYTINSPDMLTVSKMDHHFEGRTSFGTSIWVNSEEYTGVIYSNGEWAEILPFKFTTEDGVDIYGDMKTYAVAKGDLDIDSSEIYGGNSKSFVYFYHKENALAYIEKHREKTLKDYENTLLITNVDSVYAREECLFYRILRAKEPKLYYTKILQLIADDLNDGRYIHIRGNTSYHLSNLCGVNVHCGCDAGCVYFKSYELAIKARDILGDKLEYSFN